MNVISLQQTINQRLFFVLAIFPFLILKWGYEGAMTSLLSVSKPMAPLGEKKMLFIKFSKYFTIKTDKPAKFILL